MSDEFNYEVSLARYNDLSAKIKAGTQNSDEQAEFDNMLAVTVKINSGGEVAEFADGSKVVRNKPKFQPAPGVNYPDMPIPLQTFKVVFKVGQTKSQVN